MKKILISLATFILMLFSVQSVAATNPPPPHNTYDCSESIITTWPKQNGHGVFRTCPWNGNTIFPKVRTALDNLLTRIAGN